MTKAVAAEANATMLSQWWRRRRRRRKQQQSKDGGNGSGSESDSNGDGGNNRGGVVVVPSGGVRGSGSVTYDSTYVFLQIHFLRIILRRPHTDRISEGVKKSSGGTGIVIPVEKVPQEQKTPESGGFLQE